MTTLAFSTYCAYYVATMADFMGASAGYGGDPVPLVSWLLMAVATATILVVSLPGLLTDAYWRGRAVVGNHANS